MEKIKVLYDATAVCNILQNNSCRSGIFFVAYNVLLQFLKRDEFDVYLYAANQRKLRKVIEACPEFSRCKIYRFSFLDDILALCCKNKLIFSLFNVLNKIYISNFAGLKNIDAYFSPMRAPIEAALNDRHVKRYVFLHDTIPLVIDYRKDVSHGWFYKLVSTINKQDKYFANSLYTKNDFIKYVPAVNPDNIFVVPLSTGKPYYRVDDMEYINQIKKKYGISENKKYIFSLCNLDPRKNLVFSIKNFLKFVDKHKLDDFIFVLGGSHWKDFEQVINENIENLGEQKNKILRIGYVDDEDMSALYSGAEMFLFPSLYEGFGIPVLEAMKCGLPVICSNSSSLPEVIGDCGIQIDPKSDDEMIAAMEKMYFDRDFREQCVKKGLERSKLFTWERCMDVIASEIKKN